MSSAFIDTKRGHAENELVTEQVVAENLRWCTVSIPFYSHGIIVLAILQYSIRIGSGPLRKRVRNMCRQCGAVENAEAACYLKLRKPHCEAMGTWKETLMRRAYLRRSVSVILAFCMLVFAFWASSGASSGAEGRENGVFSEIDSYLQSAVKAAHIPNLSITIVGKDRVLFSRHYGDDVTVTPDSPFLIGSVSKSFTAACIMQLVEDGMVDLNAPVSEYLPDATQGDEITVRQLLNHTSGLGEHQNLSNCRIVNNQGEHHYANVNYTLLGRIIEATTGQPYEQYVTDHVLEPLRLSHTAATQAQSEENGLVQGHTDYGGFRVSDGAHYPASPEAWISVPAGYLSSSANDLGKYLQMYLNGGQNVLTPESVETMLAGDTVYVEDDIPYWYGYGWTTIREPLTETVFRHAGLVETGTACVYLLPAREIGIAITADINDYFVGNEMLDSLGWGVVLMLLGQAPNKIESAAFMAGHLGIDLIQIAILALGIVSCIFVPRRVAKLRRRSRSYGALYMGIWHIGLPLFLLFVPRIFFATPLWVVRAFVPDIFITLVASATLLFGSGVAEIIGLRRRIRRARTDPSTAGSPLSVNRLDE